MNAVTKTEPRDIAQVTPDALPADPMVSMIERMVLDPSADLDKLDRMLVMKERIDAQNAKVAFARSLSEARAEMPPIIKDATVDFKTSKGRTHYQHETLAGIAKTIDPILSKYGLSYRFRTAQENGGVVVTCIISHRDGYSEETSLGGSPDQSGSKNGFQAVGSAVTYLQRYTLKAALGLSAEVDDDGRNAGPRLEDQHQDKFNPGATVSRIALRLRKAECMDEVADIWRTEGEIILRVKNADESEYSRLEAAKNEAKARFSPPQNNNDDLMEGIDY